MVGNIGTIGYTSGTNSRTLDGIGMPVVPLVEPRMHAVVPMATNRTNGKITDGTIGRTPKSATFTTISFHALK